MQISKDTACSVLFKLHNFKALCILQGNRALCKGAAGSSGLVRTGSERISSGTRDRSSSFTAHPFSRESVCVNIAQQQQQQQQQQEGDAGSARSPRSPFAAQGAGPPLQAENRKPPSPCASHAAGGGVGEVGEVEQCTGGFDTAAAAAAPSAAATGPKGLFADEWEHNVQDKRPRWGAQWCREKGKGQGQGGGEAGEGKHYTASKAYRVIQHWWQPHLTKHVLREVRACRGDMVLHLGNCMVRVATLNCLSAVKEVA
eukprot:1161981-Pelagomonas_calceolata.AAC.17